ncbi:MAG: hypothetical protein WD623_10395 [Marinobacter sp.]|uniref:hypothetical protein n=1 Tax=Marinobacter sp. TaxID=50741 RepID=UPI00349FE0C8
MNTDDKDTSGAAGGASPDKKNELTSAPGSDERLASPEYLENLREAHDKTSRTHAQKLKTLQLRNREIRKQRQKGLSLPEHAREMTLDEMNRSFPLYFLMRWEFYFISATFVFFTAYFPWQWLADWGITRIFVTAMEQVVPSISGLSKEARHLPLDASKTQLSFIHFCCAVASTFKLLTQQPAVWRVASKTRFAAISIGMSMAGIVFVYVIFFWAGHFNSTLDEGWHANLLQVAASHTAFWLLLTVVLAMAWSGLQEVIRQAKQH